MQTAIRTIQIVQPTVQASLHQTITDRVIGYFYALVSCKIGKFETSGTESVVLVAEVTNTNSRLQNLAPDSVAATDTRKVGLLAIEAVCVLTWSDSALKRNDALVHSDLVHSDARLTPQISVTPDVATCA